MHTVQFLPLGLNELAEHLDKAPSRSHDEHQPA